jgi:hypothetical protein
MPGAKRPRNSSARRAEAGELEAMRTRHTACVPRSDRLGENRAERIVRYHDVLLTYAIADETLAGARGLCVYVLVAAAESWLRTAGAGHHLVDPLREPP